ncbi:MAG: type II toxin-antitoxin system PemK/MazF family toxin [Solirubrobacterales bacterium]
MTLPARGEVWWGETPDAKGRPFVVLTRDEAIPVLRAILVTPVTRTIRGIPTEVPLGPDEGLPTECVATLDATTVFPRAMLARRLGALSSARMRELCEAFAAATDC